MIPWIHFLINFFCKTKKANVVVSQSLNTSAMVTIKQDFLPHSCNATYICSQVEKRNVFSERGNPLQPLNSDEEEDGYDSPHARRRGASVDEFLRGSELGRQVPFFPHTLSYTHKHIHAVGPKGPTN